MTKMVRLDEMMMQGNLGVSLSMPPVCVCGVGPSEPSRQQAQALCPDCGGSLPQAAAPKPQERKQLKDFLSAFV